MPMLYSPVSGGVSVASQRTASGVTPVTSAGSGEAERSITGSMRVASGAGLDFWLVTEPSFE